MSSIHGYVFKLEARCGKVRCYNRDTFWLFIKISPAITLNSHYWIYFKCTQFLITGHIMITSCLQTPCILNVPAGYLTPCPQCGLIWENYCNTMESEYLWLCLCNSCWKVQMIWVNYFKQDQITALITKHKIPGMYLGGDTPESPTIIGSSEAGTLPRKKETRVSSPLITLFNLESSLPTPNM